MISESAVSTSNLIIGIIIAILIAMILLGGIKRIGHVTEKLVPFMALLYILLGLGVILLNIQNVPAVFVSIFRGAFQPRAVTGGIVLSMFTSLKKVFPVVSSLTRLVLVPDPLPMRVQIPKSL